MTNIFVAWASNHSPYQPLAGQNKSEKNLVWLSTKSSLSQVYKGFQSKNKCENKSAQISGSEVPKVHHFLENDSGVKRHTPPSNE